ncbi:general transcription factor 3C polypeptide 2 [Hoplias malabaricus]|uniref:general transcription factor 3C polypeptide 2 n=1 Tax=Hoplias malabaricus TaxID=27720 RepID=UPI003462A527
MAATAPEVGTQTGKKMGVPSEKEEEDQNGQINHVNSASTCDMNGHSLRVLQARDSEPQALDCDSSVMSFRQEADTKMICSSLEGSQEISEGQTADSQLFSDDDQSTVPPGSRKRRKRRRKRIGYIRKKSSTSNAEPKKETKPRAPVKKRLKIFSEPVQTPLEHEDYAVPEPPEMTPGGRPKRRAAKAALEYLHTITKDLEDSTSGKRERDSLVQSDSPASRKGPGRAKVQKRKAPDYNSDLCDDADFEPESNEELESEENDEEDYEDEISAVQNKKTIYRHKMVGSNGLSNCAMQPVWTAFNNTKKFREENCSPWVFSEWIPCITDWHHLSSSEAEIYLPQEKESATFIISREGIKDKHSLLTIKRFESLLPHADRWDSLFFAGGPVWAMEWCPLPDGAAEIQYAALYCNKGMDDRHKMDVPFTEQALLQIWDLGQLQMSRPASSPQLAYALAVDDGCIWDMKWCPAGAWELPNTDKKTFQMPRLGLIAAAFSNGTIAVYSLPHPEALKRQNKASGEASQASLIYHVQPVMTLKLGSSQADHSSLSGQCFSIDWLPVKPHNLLAAGFYDGIVALWNLSTKSPLQRVRSPDRSLCLYPYHCFPAHDNRIRSLSWCRASSVLLATVAEDRMAKLWDTTKTCVPLKTIKRFLPTEVSWPILWSGIFLTQESCFSALGHQGLHYLDSGYLGQKPFFVCTRKATVWSHSVSDWVNSCLMGDNIGDLVCSLLCDPDCNYSNTKRHRFPVYRTELVEFRPNQGLNQTEEEEGKAPQKEPQDYKGAAKKYYIHFHDMDLRSFKKYQNKPLTKQLHNSEMKGILPVDVMPLNAIYKVRFNPNMDAHGWVVSAGHSGLVRVHCVRGLSGPVMHKLVSEAQDQFSAMFNSQEQNSAIPSVHHCIADTVEVQ